MKHIFKVCIGLLISLLSSFGLRAQEISHPVLAGKGGANESLLKEFTEKEWLELVPRQSPRKGVIAPMGKKNIPVEQWEWNPHSPNQLTCKTSSEVYPSDSFPLKFTKVEVLSGKTIDIPYWLSNSEKVEVQTNIDYRKFYYLEGALKRLGPSYAGTGDERYARIVAIILDTWANYVPDYFISGRGGVISPSEAEIQHWFVSRVSDHNGLAHEWPHNALYAFDCIYDSKALKDLSAERGYDVRSHIEKDLFFNIGDLFSKRVKVPWALQTNLSLPYMVLADAATILNRPDYIDYLNEYLQATINDNFVRDGMYPESFTYHRGYADVNYAAAKNVERYFTMRPADTETLRVTKARSEERVSFLKRASEAHFPVCYPNGVLPPWGDSSAPLVAPRTETHSAVLPAYGFVALGAGDGNQQTQFNVGFNEFNNHCHADVLGIMLFAHGEELIGNNRYARSAGRGFNNSTLGHNTVVIDRSDQPRRGAISSGGNLVLYEPGIGGISAAEVDGVRAYPGKANRYQRLSILNAVDPASPYVLDLFAVKGGKTHDYVVHGATTFEEKSLISLPATEIKSAHPLLIPGETWKDPRVMEDTFPVYGMITNVREAQSPGNYDVTYLGKKNELGTRMFLLDSGTHHIFLGQSPLIGGNENPLSDETATRGKDHKKYEASGEEDVKGKSDTKSYARGFRPALLVRNESVATESLQSLFINLIEPIQKRSRIEKVERIPLKEESADAVALHVLFIDGREDVLLVNLNNPNVTGCNSDLKEIVSRDGTYELQGRIGTYVKSKDGRVTATIIGASRFKFGAVSLKDEHFILTGNLVASERMKDGAKTNILVADTELPNADQLKDKWMSISFGTLENAPNLKISEQFQIDHAEVHQGKTQLYMKEDQAFSISDEVVEQKMRPKRRYKGPARYEIISSRLFDRR